MNDTNTRVRELLQEAINLLQTSDVPKDTRPHPAPAEAKGDQIELTGTIGRPEYREIKGLPLWTAGLGVRRIDGRLEWVTLQAWRKRAISAEETINRGDTITVIGRWTENSWTDKENCEIRTRDVFVIDHFESISDAA